MSNVSLIFIFPGEVGNYKHLEDTGTGNVPPALHRKHLALQMEISTAFLFMEPILAFLDPDPDPESG
jgi:hypothetical protein